MHAVYKMAAHFRTAHQPLPRHFGNKISSKIILISPISVLFYLFASYLNNLHRVQVFHLSLFVSVLSIPPSHILYFNSRYIMLRSLQSVRSISVTAVRNQDLIQQAFLKKIKEYAQKGGDLANSDPAVCFLFSIPFYVYRCRLRSPFRMSSTDWL